MRAYERALAEELGYARAWVFDSGSRDAVRLHPAAPLLLPIAGATVQIR